MTNLKINTTKDEAQKLAQTYGIGQDIVNEFEYKDEPVLINVSPNINPQKMPDAERLKSFLDRIERLEEERRELGADIREIYAEAKGNGFDTKVMRQILRLKKMTPADRAEAEFLLDSYKKMLGIES